MNPLTLAIFVINHSQENNSPVNNLELQKILYFLQLKNYQLTGSPLIVPDRFEAWEFGPVVREVYVRYSYYGASKIFMPQPQSHVRLDPALVNTIDYWSHSKPWVMVNYSHRAEGAWKQYYQTGCKNPIPEQAVKNEAEIYHEVDAAA
ncbi:MAG: SocA family protein [Succinivibrio sp.]|nr:SocA family protein [Succinivibrio sp.]